MTTWSQLLYVLTVADQDVPTSGGVLVGDAAANARSEMRWEGSKMIPQASPPFQTDSDLHIHLLPRDSGGGEVMRRWLAARPVFGWDAELTSITQVSVERRRRDGLLGLAATAC